MDLKMGGGGYGLKTRGMGTDSNKKKGGIGTKTKRRGTDYWTISPRGKGTD